MIEQDWSGRGQHARFEKDEQSLINEILEPMDLLGSTQKAVVQSVKCRRILLARKTITCGKHTITQKEAVLEVSHLTRLHHAHILRVIGTYVKSRELSILLYPVADYNLETFCEEYAKASSLPKKTRMRESSLSFYSCLSSGVQYIHQNLIKHMDIKPQNILVRARQARYQYTVLIADFGIARSYATLDDTETDGMTPFTKRYAAPEVVKQDLRGLPADVFSLGCVFIEIFENFESECYYDTFPRGYLKLVLGSNYQESSSYQATIYVFQAFADSQANLRSWHAPKLRMISRMLSLNAADRPRATELVQHFEERDCCRSGSVQLEAM
jgi:serine/threonine protein kinase